jgi:membrane protein YdbS with pleckstrin-like domain
MIVVLFVAIAYIQYTGRPLSDLAFNLVLLFTVVMLIGTEIHRLGNRYEIHENSIIHSQGYFKIRSKRIEFGALSDIDVEQTPWQRIFNFGDIILFKFAEGPTLKHLNKPHDFADTIEKEIARLRS